MINRLLLLLLIPICVCLFLFFYVYMYGVFFNEKNVKEFTESDAVALVIAKTQRSLSCMKIYSEERDTYFHIEFRNDSSLACGGTGMNETLMGMYKVEKLNKEIFQYNVTDDVFEPL